MDGIYIYIPYIYVCVYVLYDVYDVYIYISKV